MVWQDIVLMIAIFVSGLALVPQVCAGFKGKKSTVLIKTSLPTFIGLISMCVAYFTLGLIFAGTTTSIMALLWGLLLIQGITYR